VLEQVRLVAPKNTTVLITGETGTGKERISRAIHRFSNRRKLPMISVNCGGIPATLLEDEFFGHVKGAFTDAHQARMGRFEQAHRSTIFLDEIGDLPLELQPKLLRVLQEREIHRVGGVESVQLDVRVIAATNVDLWSRVNEGSFREDLFYRINVFPIHLPPLRERREDIPLFVAHFLEKFCRRDNLSPKRLRPPAEAELMGRPWLGNIRELENAVEIAVIRSQDREEVDISDFPPARGPFRSPAFAAAASASDFKGMVTQFEKDLILRVLERTNGNKSQAAGILRLKRTTLLEKLKKFESETEAEAAL
jgi:transcriptional regulator with GAF, ATPase, and Fis domain